MKIGIIGNGVVGNATARTYMEFHDVHVYDTVKEKSSHTLDEVLQCEMIFICLPTPQGTNENPMALNTQAITKLLSEDISRKYRKTCFIIKSTVPVGFTDRMAEIYSFDNLFHSPEFLTARCAVTDAQIPSRNIIGVPTSRKRLSLIHLEALRELQNLYRRRFPGIRVHVMSSHESEFLKLMQNSFFATKIGFFNEMYALATHLQLDWEPIMKGLLSDGRIAHSHTKVPGPDGEFGFGGACLPKDLASMITELDKSKLQHGILRAVYDRNEMLDRT